jgi:hypothetical protein
LMRKPLSVRRVALAETCTDLNVPQVGFSAGVVGAGKAFFAAALAQGHEGVVAKHLGLCVEAGVRKPPLFCLYTMQRTCPQSPFLAYSSCCSGCKLTNLRFKEETHVRSRNHHYPPPRPPVPLVLEQLWSRLTSEQRQQTLMTLSGVVVRQLGAARDEQEVRDERQ